MIEAFTCQNRPQCCFASNISSSEWESHTCCTVHSNSQQLDPLNIYIQSQHNCPYHRVVRKYVLFLASSDVASYPQLLSNPTWDLRGSRIICILAQSLHISDQRCGWPFHKPVGWSQPSSLVICRIYLFKTHAQFFSNVSYILERPSIHIWKKCSHEVSVYQRERCWGS